MDQDEHRKNCSKEVIEQLEIMNPDKDDLPSDSSSDESDEDVGAEWDLLSYYVHWLLKLQNPLHN